MITTFAELVEFLGTKLEAAQARMPELDRAKLISDIVCETAMFTLGATPSSGNHRLWLASDLMRRLRGFEGPFFVVAREMGTDEELRAAFDAFLSHTEGWDEVHH